MVVERDVSYLFKNKTDIFSFLKKATEQGYLMPTKKEPTTFYEDAVHYFENKDLFYLVCAKRDGIYRIMYGVDRKYLEKDNRRIVNWCGKKSNYQNYWRLNNG